MVNVVESPKQVWLSVAIIGIIEITIDWVMTELFWITVLILPEPLSAIPVMLKLPELYQFTVRLGVEDEKGIETLSP